jgi:ATP-dependent DNA helicase RecG
MYSTDFFSSPIEYLKGVGPQRAELLKKETGIHTFGDLLSYFPFRYVDRTKYYRIKEVTAELPYVQVRGKLVSLAVVGEKRSKRLVGKLQDDTGMLELVWFAGIKWLKDSLQLNREYIIFGRIAEYKGHLNMPHPEMEASEEADKQTASSMQAVYNTSEKLKSRGLDSRGMLRLQKTLHLQLPRIPEVLSAEILEGLRLMPRHESYVNVHFPKSAEELQKATFRLKFEEFFFLQLRLLISKVIRTEKFSGKKFERVGEYFNRFYKEKLPFPLTEAQKRVIREIRNDCGSGKQMNRLLQGDVGSGKTVVALLAMLIAIDNGYQACLMAPTEILASQHGETITELLKGMNVNVALLTGSTKKPQRRIIHEELQNGKINILIGTHALIEDNVRFKNLGLAVVDEQHRFGVAQRAQLQLKSSPGLVLPTEGRAGSGNSIHVLVMTATPIPRTLAMTLYGDLDVSVIDELPPGRKPIRTEHRTDSHRLSVWGFLKKQISEGRQIYIVYPLIEESAKLDLKNLEEGYAAICHDFPMPEYKVSIVHGKMKAKDKDFEMQRFVKGQTNIMVATTVIEVGVNVPNASVMVIESAERFGLSQLHQLRGRVGRGASQSYCILMTKDGLGRESYQRIKTMCSTNDGFKIAEVDLQLRGAGDIEGTQQSGNMDLKIANLARDGSILQAARDAAMKVLADDPHLQKEQHIMINKKLTMIMRGEFQWGRVG